MTVNDLFEHFNLLFSKIIYFCPEDRIEDYVYVEKIDEEFDGKFDEEEQLKFQREYGDYEVDSWKYDYRYNSIDIIISNLWAEEDEEDEEIH